MLRLLQKAEFDSYSEFAYELALDLTRSVYPTYCDGIKTKEDFMDRAQRAFSLDDEEILLFEHDGSVEGWIHYYALPQDRYVSFCAFNVRSYPGQAIEEVISYLKERYSGCRLYFGLPDRNEAFAEHLRSLSFAEEEESYVDVLRFADYLPSNPGEGFLKITKDNFERFARLHKVHDGDMYWNNARLYDDIDNWSIYLLEEEQSLGAVCFCYPDSATMEIFSMDYRDNTFDLGTFRRLLTKTLAVGKEEELEHLIFFVDEQEHSVTMELGFRHVSKYVLYSGEI